VANHTQNHPIRKMSAVQAAREIEEGFASLRKAVEDSQAVSPFFRIPGLLRQKSVEQYLATHGDMTWSVDFLADDWTRINNSEVARRAISRIEARGTARAAYESIVNAPTAPTAKAGLIAARKGERDPSRLCDRAVTLWRNRWPPPRGDPAKSRWTPPEISLPPCDGLPLRRAAIGVSAQRRRSLPCGSHRAPRQASTAWAHGST